MAKENDLGANWQEMLTSWESNVNKFANSAMGSDQFSQIMNKVTGAGAGVRQNFEQIMQRYLATMNLPSRQDLTSLGERLQGIEAQLYHLTQLVERIAAKEGVSAPETSAPKPARTRRPPEAAQESK